MSEKISMRLQTPPDANGNRKDINLVTTADEVIVNPDSANSTTLSEKLDQISGIQLQDSQPKFPCIWAKPVKRK